MKRLSIVLLLLISVAFIATSCREPKDEWVRFYGYTKEDVIGHYEANPDSTLYEELPTEGVQVYPDAEIDITEYNDYMVNVRIKIPNKLYKNFRGVVAINEDDSEIAIGDESDGSDILMTVYRNTKNGVRLHGRERQHKLWTNPISYDYIIYGFDVIKTDENPTK